MATDIFMPIMWMYGPKNVPTSLAVWTENCTERFVTKWKRLVQVAWEMDEKGFFDREVTAIREDRNNTGIFNCTVVIWDSERALENGICVIPVWEWLWEEDAHCVDG